MKEEKKIINEKYISVDFKEILEEKYLSYALSTIMSRSLPDVRDGLKPVHRRLIYAMDQLSLSPQSGFKKCARIVGDVMGKFHPHGDSGIYGAMVRMAQDFSLRYPLIEGQGNFGNIDGDNAAAMRYTEARLSEFAQLLLEDINKNCVEFSKTYDGTEDEPKIFPAAFPNILANGATGIAVGMATSIPPHNLSEIFSALIFLIENNGDGTTEEILDHILGPDFPTGGELFETKKNLINAYETGRGSFLIRAKWKIEELGSGLYQILIFEIPYMVEKSKLIEKIALEIIEKKNPYITDVRDESTDEIRIVLIPKSRNVNPEILMESLFRKTDLETKFNLNLNVLDENSIPSVMSLKSVLQNFLTYRKLILQKKSLYRIEKVEARFNLLKGYLTAYLNIDEVINIIRNNDEPKIILIEKFSLNEIQAESILNMKLRNLRNLEEIEIKAEEKKLEKELNELNKLIKNEKMQWSVIKNEFEKLKEKFGESHPLGKRRTKIISEIKSIEIPDDEEIIELENITVIFSKFNWVRAVRGNDLSSIKFREGDQRKFGIECTTLDKLIIVTTNGKAFSIDAHKIRKTKSQWEHLKLMIDVLDDFEIVNVYVLKVVSKKNERNENEEEKETEGKETEGKETEGKESEGISMVNQNEVSEEIMLITSSGFGFKTSLNGILSQTKAGKQIIKLNENDKLFWSEKILENDSLVLITTNRKMLAISVKLIPSLTKGRGVRLQKCAENVKISDAQLCKKAHGIHWFLDGAKKTKEHISLWCGKKGGVGKMTPLRFPKNNKFNIQN